MNGSFQEIGKSALTILAILAIGVGLVIWFRRLRDRQGILLRLAISAVLVPLTYFVAFEQVRRGGYAAIAGIFFTLGFGWLLAIVWAPAIAGYFGNLLGSLFDGGAQEVEPKPFYSIFHSKRQKGKYYEALAEVRRQLDKFPNDFEGMMLLADLQAQNLNDLPGAEVTIHRLCGRPDLPPANVASALNQLADWHLSLTKDREAAQRNLEKIIELLPDTEMSLKAAQRLGHLADPETLLAASDRQRISVKKGVQNLGLHRQNGRLRVPEVDQEQVAADYVRHLEQHPLDAEIREKLAALYVSHYHRLDLALDQIEQLIQQPGHPARKVVHWLNLIVDFQVLEGADFENIRQTLQRIIGLYPDLAAAQTARRRLDGLRLELKGKAGQSTVKLGDYEQNIGLKKNRPPDNQD